MSISVPVRRTSKDDIAVYTSCGLACIEPKSTRGKQAMNDSVLVTEDVLLDFIELCKMHQLRIVFNPSPSPKEYEEEMKFKQIVQRVLDEGRPS